MTPYLVAGTAAVALAAGVWMGYKAGADRYLDGFQAGVESQQKLSDAEMQRVIASARSAAEKARADGFQKALEQERARQDEIQQAARRLEQDKRALADRVAALLRRVRRAESPSVADSGSGGVPPSGPADAAGTDSDQLLAADRRMVELAGAADAEAANYRACYRWIYGPQVRTDEPT